MRLFDNKVALVTGGAMGIGHAAVLRYAEEGAKIAVVDINDAEGERTAAGVVDRGGDAIYIRADMTRPADIEAMVAKTVEHFGRLDVAFNNAGISGRFTNVVDCTEEEWDLVSALNLKSVWLCMKYEIAAMLAAGAGGAIVNTASEAANHPPPHMATYTATKAGVVGLTRSAALDFAGQGIRVNALLPGPTETPLLVKGTEGLDLTLDEFGALLPMRRIAKAVEQANVAVWLTSSQASFLTGVALSVDGGQNLI